MSFALPVDTTLSSNSPNALRAFTLLLLQKQGSYYTRDHMESALNTAEGYQAFKIWTEFYSNYGVDAESNLFTRMRTGIMPIGICNYATYMQLATSAPELYGLWGIAPVPGMEMKDGTVDHSVGTMSSTAAMILNQSDKQEEAWQFLSWWMSEETQIQYGRELEALIGVGARWNTANINAFYSLPWDTDDIDVIKAQMESAKEQLIVPGGYFTGRHIINAWNRVILNDENARDAIEEAVKDINKELATKRKEFGLDKEVQEE
jgi:ABC-type glycerol-3-phosphate transport system substrate-binding protein